MTICILSAFYNSFRRLVGIILILASKKIISFISLFPNPNNRSMNFITLQDWKLDPRLDRRQFFSENDSEKFYYTSS